MTSGSVPDGGTSRIGASARPRAGPAETASVKVALVAAPNVLGCGKKLLATAAEVS